MVLSRNHDINKRMKSERPNSGGYANLSEGTNRDTNGFIMTEDPKSTNLYRGGSSPSAPYVQQGNEEV